MLGTAKPRTNGCPTDRATIRELLLTWPVRQIRDIAVPPPREGDKDADWSWKYEQRFGAPNVRDREEALRIALNVLVDSGKDVGRIVEVLRGVKHAALENALLASTIDDQREQAKEAEVVRRNLTKWLLRAIHLHQHTNPSDLPTARRFRNTYEGMLTSLTFDKRMSDQERAARDWLFAPRPGAITRRRAKRGNPDVTLVKNAKSQLRDVAVPREHRSTLLWAIGLVDQDGLPPRRGILTRK